ncbi:major capsid protein [Peromfec virus RodF7_7]|uniref:Major capsid protein n=1 Tax=Peromfec virus RodF7_7 TaxID=2929355 RepID=A0A976N2W8_9VIRU|nr:major capsid protein [Peromfec virus RodF7_7]
MSNIMNMKDVKNHVHRSGFDNSRRVCFTAKIGEILPLDWMPVLPGDDITINLNSFGRTAPLQTASFARVREYYDVYFVPYRLLWNQFNDWIKQTDAKSIAKSLISPSDDFETMPYFTSTDLKNYYSFLDSDGAALYDDAMMLQKDSSKRLLRYLGYESYISTDEYPKPNQALSPFPLLAYQKIYQDFYRFSQWEDTAPWTCNLDYINTSSQLHLSIGSLFSPGNMNQKNLFRMQYCNYDKDYFNGLLPNAQYGDESIVSLTGEIPAGGYFNLGTLSFNLRPNDSSPMGSLNLNNATPTTGNPYPRVGYSGSSIQKGSLEGVAAENFGSSALDSGIVSSFSVLALRRAECLQKWKEITMSGDTDYTSQLAKHWNVSVPKTLSQRCQYLGGTASNLDISEVINTNLTDGASADIFGKGVISNNGHIKFTNPSNDYGIIMVMYHCKPIVEWKSSSVRARSLTAVHKTDFPIPEFDSIGMEQVFLHEFYNQSSAALYTSQVAGYAPRYIDYKTSFDIVKGEFEDSLESWCLPYDLDRYFTVTGVGYVDYRAFKVTPTIADNLFGVSARQADQFYNSLYLDIKSVRNLSRDGLPY